MSTTTLAKSTEPGPARGGVSAAMGEYWARVRGGDIGALPAVLGIVVLVVFFTALQKETFFSAYNFANLLNQGATVIVIAMGLIFVLLLGEIDLSAGFAAGTAAALLGVASNNWGWPWYLSVGVCLLTGVVIGLVLGLLFARLGIPSFVVTLAAFLALQGVMLLIIGKGGTIPVRDDVILAVMNKNLPVWLGWALTALSVATYLGLTLRRVATRRRSGLPVEATAVWAGRVAVLAVVLVGATWVLSLERARNTKITSIQGVPYVVPLLAVLLIGLTFLLTRTAFGRHVYAVGGNAEAARRAGINVANIRTICFVACSTLAAVAGILFASRDNSVSPTTGGATTLLFGVGAAVIGGTSLFGGRGKVRDAILGGLVVAIIANGLPLITQESGVQYIVTGAVLALAASVDALSRRRATATGRA